MKTLHTTAVFCLPLLLATSPLWAQTTPTDAPVNTATPPRSEAMPVPEQMGGATRRLLAQQRQGLNASTVDRSIDGQVAARSHERYLKTFENPQPVWFDSRLEEAQQ